MKLNPVYTKDSKINNRSLRIIVTMVAYNCVLLVIGFAFILATTNGLSENGYMDYASMLELYVMFATVQIGTLLLLTPALTAGTISGERERQTLDMLLATKMRPMSILVGKLLSSMDIILTLVLSAMPTMAMVFLFGGIRILELFRMQVLLVLLGITVGAAGIFFSTVTSRTTAATIVSYIYTAVLTIGTFCITYVLNFTVGNSNTRFGRIMAHAGYILLLNPVMSFYVLISQQVGDVNAASAALKLISGVDYGSNFITLHWLGISLVLQIGITLVLLVAAALYLEPIRPDWKRLE